MGILSKFSSKGRKKDSSGSRLKLYAATDRNLAQESEPVSGDAEVDDELMLSSDSAGDEAAGIELAPLQEAKTEPSQVEAVDEEEVFLLAPIERELAEIDEEVSMEKRGELFELPDGWREVDESAWSLELLEAMDWKLFEDLCAEVFRKKNYRAELTASGPDGGIDIIVHRSGESDPKGISVQCKRYSYPVTAKLVREFYGASLRDEHEEMIFITSNVFNKRAKEEFDGVRAITLVDGKTLLKVIERLGSGIAEELLQRVVGDAEGWQTQTCPNCDLKMVRKTARRSGKGFWRCQNFSKVGEGKCWRRL